MAKPGSGKRKMAAVRKRQAKATQSSLSKIWAIFKPHKKRKKKW